jgi:chemotaxis-related protein WspD
VSSELHLTKADAGKPKSAIVPYGDSGEIRPCWNEIGVYGNGQCEELLKFVHCRNCPVYSKAGSSLLNRALPEGYRHAWTAHYAQKKTLGKQARISVLVFRISQEWLALPTQAFQEVAERRLIHSLPHRRQAIVLGLANVRGELVTCVSLGRALGVENVAPRPTLRTMYDRLLVARWDGQRLAFPVDEVFGIHRFDLAQLKPAPAVVSKSTQTFSRGILQWQQHTIGFLNAELLFSFLNRNLT